MEETKGGSQGSWSEGGAVESLSPDAARAEIKSIENDPSFAGDGQMDYWSRQKMLKRRDALYRHAAPSPEEAAILKGQEEARAKESLDREIEKYEDRDDKEERDKLMSNLTTYFGGEKETEAAIKSARGVLKRFAKPADLVFLDETKLGNDPELIQKLAEIGDILQRGGKKKK